VLLALGLTEVVTPSLVDGEREGRIVSGDSLFATPVPLRNPMSRDRSHLRGSLVPSLLEVLATNRARSTANLGIFEVGRVFAGDPDLGLVEGQRAGLLLAGTGPARGGVGAGKSCDFFDIKGLVEVYVEEFWGRRLRLEDVRTEPLEPHRAAVVVVGGLQVGAIGEVGEPARRAWDLPDDLPVLVAELDLDARLDRSRADAQWSPVPRYPGVLRDLALVVTRTVRHGDLEAAVREAGGELLAEVGLFDVYEGPPLGADEKSLAYGLVFRSPERSLQSAEVDGLVEEVVAHVARTHGARIR
jgi:phenylalanyl-tRNA synthetase beta chain